MNESFSKTIAEAEHNAHWINNEADLLDYESMGQGDRVRKASMIVTAACDMAKALEKVALLNKATEDFGNDYVAGHYIRDGITIDDYRIMAKAFDDFVEAVGRDSHREEFRDRPEEASGPEDESTSARITTFGPGGG